MYLLRTSKKTLGSFKSCEKYCLEAVKQDGYTLQFVKNQTEEICLEAVRNDAYALKYVKNQTEKVCLEAVKQNGYALKYIDNQCIIRFILIDKRPYYTMHFSFIAFRRARKPPEHSRAR